jgi:hypothetical protein
MNGTILAAREATVSEGEVKRTDPDTSDLTRETILVPSRYV